MSRIIILIGVAVVAGLAATNPVRPQSSVSTSSSREALIDVLSGVTYAEYLLLSCRSPTMLPEVAGTSKYDCAQNYFNPGYIALIEALDKVLRLYDLQEKLLENNNSSLETTTLQLAIDAVLNQTCHWVCLSDNIMNTVC